jgi:replicative DNA helicase
MMTNDGIERFAISLILQSRDASDFAKGKLSKDDFFDPFHGRIIDALFRLPETSPWDLKCFADYMGMDKSNGEFTELNALYTEAFSGGFHFKDSVQIVENTVASVVARAKKRSTKLACEDVARKCIDPQVDIQTIESDVTEIQNQLCAGSQKKTWSERTREWVIKLEEKYNSSHKRCSLGTGLPTIDKLIYRFLPGELVVVSAKRKVGKSAFMIGIVNAFSVDGKTPGLVLTLEMGISEWYDRIFAYRCGIDSQIISNPSLASDYHIAKIMTQVTTVQGATVSIEDSDCFTINQIESLIRYYRVKHNIEYAIVDHVQLIQSPGVKNSNRTDELDKIGARLKNLAKKLGIVIFLLSQTNAQGVTFGASMLEAHLTKLIRLEIPELKEGEKEEHTPRRYVNLALNRSGKTGGVEASFDGATCRFTEVVRTKKDPPVSESSYPYEDNARNRAKERNEA